MSKQLFTLPPSKARGFTSNKESTNSMRSNFLKTFKADGETTITDSLQNRVGVEIVNDETLFLKEASAKETPSTNTGRIWVRSDAPSKLIFTNDSGVDLELTPGLGDILTIGNDAGNNTVTNVSKLNFNGSIVAGTETTAATSSTNTSIVLGNGSSSTETYTAVIGNNSSSSNAYGVVLGHGNTQTSSSPNANGYGGVLVGNTITSYGPGICIGKRITNTCTNQDSNNASILIGKDISFTGSSGGAVAIGDDTVPNTNSITIGKLAAANNAGEQVIVGNEARGDAIGCVAVGRSSRCNNAYGIAVGAFSFADQIHDIAIGYQAKSYGSYSIAIGSHSQANDIREISIGKYASYNTPANSEDAISIGHSAYANYNFSVALGYNVSCRVLDEFANRQTRTIRGQVTTISNIATTILSFPTEANDVLHVEASITARRNTGLVTYMASFKNYHFRNKAGTLSQSTTVGTRTQDTSDNALGYESVIRVAGNNIEIDVTGRVDETVVWTGIMRVYGAPFA